ncbi:nucleolar and coiled-body phosphoprotein 1-like [Rhipicephalus sanguineus]|uniref:nucleolar and coiled-body phosphoprotein 1-like n=1 Tax=Rhipicephalus sanguineus TaxID=34632 RepID=UPI0018953585|nr:nucleolar and coiled-body phosphoprotein 1-like [Rhipicephalus sanguineus]
MSSDPYGDVVALVLVLAAALLVAAVVWLLVRKCRAEQAYSMDCTPPKLASPRSTPMLSSSPRLEDDQQKPSSAAPTPVDKETSAVKAAPTPTVDTSHVLSRDVSTTAKSPDRQRDAPSRMESASRSRSGPSSDAGDHDQMIPVTPLDHAKEQALFWGVPHEPSQAMPLTEPMWAYRRGSHEDVAMKTEDEKKAPSEAENEFGVEHVALGKSSVPGDKAMGLTSSEVKDQHSERHQASREVRKRKSRKTSRSSIDKSTIGSVRRQRKHHPPEAPSAVDAAKPSACGQPEVTSHPHQRAAHGAVIVTTPGNVTTVASTVRTDERPSKKPRGGRSQRRKSKGRSSVTSIPAERDANGKPSAAGRGGPALPTAIAVPAASFCKVTPEAAAQDPFKTVVSSVIDSASLTSLPHNPAAPGNAMAENTASHPSPASFSTAAQTPGGEAHDLYKTSSVKGTSQADFAPLASGSANAPVVKPSTDDYSHGAANDSDIGPVTNCLAEAPVLGTASPLDASFPVDKKGAA